MRSPQRNSLGAGISSAAELSVCCPDSYTYSKICLEYRSLNQASACSLSTLHFLKLLENKLELMMILENKLESLKLLENKLESMMILENKLESLKLQENQPVYTILAELHLRLYKDTQKLHMAPSSSV
ncbi:hypothetical protein Tco_0439457 [Tanacetum coccineum]